MPMMNAARRSSSSLVLAALALLVLPVVAEAQLFVGFGDQSTQSFPAPTGLKDFDDPNIEFLVPAVPSLEEDHDRLFRCTVMPTKNGKGVKRAKFRFDALISDFGLTPVLDPPPVTRRSSRDGIDLLYFGTTDRTIALEWPEGVDTIVEVEIVPLNLKSIDALVVGCHFIDFMPCVPGSMTLCLDDGRFELTADPPVPVEVTGDLEGIFFFGDDDVTIGIENRCGKNSKRRATILDGSHAGTDDLFLFDTLTGESTLIFTDGFESGDTSAWGFSCP